MPADRTDALTYTPGTWLGVARAGTVVLLRPDTDRALVDSLWSLLAADPEIHEVLDAVTSASGGSLARLPWFGIIGFGGSLQVFLRGGIDLDVRLEGGDAVALSGRDVSTWTERRFAAVAGFIVAVPDAGVDPGADAPSSAPAGAAPPAALPLGEGVVLLQALQYGPAVAGADGIAATGSTAGPAPEAASPVGARPQPLASAAPVDDQLLAAVEADIAVEQGNHGNSADTVVELPDEDPAADLAAGPDLEGTMQPPGEDEPAEQEPTGSYDHLWEQTVMRSIEDAAVREDRDGEAEPGPDEVPPAAAPGPSGAAGDGAAAPADDENRTDRSGAFPPGGPTATPVERPAIPAGLIDSVPWQTGPGRADSAAGPGPAAGGTGPAAPPSLLAPPPPPAAHDQAPDAPAAQPVPDTDHDGQTIMKSALAPGTAGPRAAPQSAADSGTGPMVLARVCAHGHANPPTSAHCAYCRQPLPGDGVQVRRPRLGRMRLSTGELIDLDQSLIVGRQPSVSRVQGAVMPKLVQVASPAGDISRSHLEVRLEGWHVMLCDLKATNGTVLLREGQAPRRLAQGETAILFDGDIAELGEGIQLRFEELL